MAQTFFKDKEYALGVFANSREVDQAELRSIFSRAALRRGLEVNSTGGFGKLDKTDPVIVFKVAANTPFTEMQSVIDIVREAVSGAVVVSLSQDIYGKEFAVTEDRIQRMRNEAILKSVPVR